MTESSSAPAPRRLIRATIEMEIPGDYSENDLAGHLFPKLGEIDCSKARFIVASAVPEDSPTAEELADLLSHFMLTQFPDLHTDVNQNIMSVNMLSTNLGAALAFPLINSTPGTRDGEAVVDTVLSRVREITYDVAHRAGHVRILNALPTPSPSGMN